MAFMKYSKEELAYYNASSIDLVANSVGVQLEQRVDPKGWQRSKDSAGKAITKLAFHLASNSFHNFESGQTDRPIGFLMDWQGMSFHEAVNYLKENDFPKVDGSQLTTKRTPVHQEKFRYDFKLSPDKSSLKNYLIETRKISAGLVDKLLRARLIEQDMRKNILFHYKRGNEIVGATIQGTILSDNYGKRGTFKGIAPNSESNFGFHFSFGEPQALYIFEAPIDALSYYTLHQETRQNVMYGVETGFSTQTVENFVEYAKDRGDEDIIQQGVHICVDNDAPGVKYWSHFAKLNAFSEGEGLFHNGLPDFYSVPQNIMSLYTGALEQCNGSHLSVLPLLALHKFETNFENSTRLANKEGFHHFFGKPGKEELYAAGEMEERIDTLAQAYVANQGDIVKTAQNANLKDTVNFNFLAIVRHLSQTYEERLVVKLQKDMMKDWNNVLQRNVELQEAGTALSHDSAFDQDLPQFNYHPEAKGQEAHEMYEPPEYEDELVHELEL